MIVRLCDTSFSTNGPRVGVVGAGGNVCCALPARCGAGAAADCRTHSSRGLLAQTRIKVWAVVVHFTVDHGFFLL